MAKRIGRGEFLLVILVLPSIKAKREEVFQE
jgi:hypothetical protein